jgi:hypothetical protein
VADISTAQRKQAASEGEAMPGGRYPIRNRDDLQNAIHAVGRAKGGEAGRAAVRRFIIKRAKALGLSSMIPGSWRPDGTLWTADEDMADDRKHGIKEGSPRDKALDAKRGLPSR